MQSREELDGHIKAHVEQMERALAEFRKKFSISFIVSISGGADDNNLPYARQNITQLLDVLRGTNAAILTGGTKGGIPELGTTIAKQKGLATIGVFPPRARKDALLDKLDFTIETLPPMVGPASYGSETPTFAQLPDYAVYLGGAYGTLAEVSTMLKVNAKRKKDKAEPIHIIPLEGSAGVAALIPMLVQITPDLSFCLPELAIQTGRQAGEYIRATQAAKAR